MRRIFRILSLVLIYLIVSAKSCDSDEQFTREIEQKQVLRARDSIASAFEMDSLSQASLRAFEVTAELKLNDLADYLKILNDSSAGNAFKEKAGEMAGALFIPGKKVPIDLSGSGFDSIRVLMPLQQLNDSVCSGQLRFTILLPRSVSSGGEIPRGKNKIVDIFTLKQEKVFGRDRIKVWNVLLGDIR